MFYMKQENLDKHYESFQKLHMYYSFKLLLDATVSLLYTTAFFACVLWENESWYELSHGKLFMH